MPVFREYPKLVYHSDGRTFAVADAAEQATYVAAGWSLTPNTFTPGVRRVTAVTTAATWLPPNTKRRTLKLVNDSAAIARFKYGPGCTSTDFSWILDPGERWEMPLVDGRPEYTGLITGLWESANGAVQITETEFP